MSSEYKSNTFIIPDQVLETHTCRLCDKYLSVCPITVHPDGGNICGRCHQKVNEDSHCLFECGSEIDLIEQVNIPYAILGYVNHLFPCVNRYEGCKKLLALGDVGTHETTCQSRKLLCRYCNYEGTGSQQINHFKMIHPSNFFNKINFRFPLQESCTNLIKRDEDLFFLHVEFREHQVEMFVKPTKWLENDIDFFCLLKDITGEVIDQTILQRRSQEGILHRIQIKDFLDVDVDTFLCDCLLKSSVK